MADQPLCVTAFLWLFHLLGLLCALVATPSALYLRTTEPCVTAKLENGAGACRWVILISWRWLFSTAFAPFVACQMAGVTFAVMGMLDMEESGPIWGYCCVGFAALCLAGLGYGRSLDSDHAFACVKKCHPQHPKRYATATLWAQLDLLAAVCLFAQTCAVFQIPVLLSYLYTPKADDASSALSMRSAIFTGVPMTLAHWVCFIPCALLLCSWRRGELLQCWEESDFDPSGLGQCSLIVKVGMSPALHCAVLREFVFLLVNVAAFAVFLCLTLLTPWRWVSCHRRLKDGGVEKVSEVLFTEAAGGFMDSVCLIPGMLIVLAPWRWRELCRRLQSDIYVIGVDDYRTVYAFQGLLSLCDAVAGLLAIPTVLIIPWRITTLCRLLREDASHLDRVPAIVAGQVAHGAADLICLLPTPLLVLAPQRVYIMFKQLKTKDADTFRNVFALQSLLGLVDLACFLLFVLCAVCMGYRAMEIVKATKTASDGGDLHLWERLAAALQRFQSSSVVQFCMLLCDLLVVPMCAILFCLTCYRVGWVKTELKALNDTEPLRFAASPAPHWILLGHFASLVLDVVLLLLFIATLPMIWRSPLTIRALCAVRNGNSNQKMMRGRIALVEGVFWGFVDIPFTAPFVLLAFVSCCAFSWRLSWLKTKLNQSQTKNAMRYWVCKNAILGVFDLLCFPLAVLVIITCWRARQYTQDVYEKPHVDEEIDFCQQGDVAELREIAADKALHVSAAAAPFQLHAPDDNLCATLFVPDPYHVATVYHFGNLLLDVPFIFMFVLINVSCWRRPLLAFLLQDAEAEADGKLSDFSRRKLIAVHCCLLFSDIPAVMFLIVLSVTWRSCYVWSLLSRHGLPKMHRIIFGQALELLFDIPYIVCATLCFWRWPWLLPRLATLLPQLEEPEEEWRSVILDTFIECIKDIAILGPCTILLVCPWRISSSFTSVSRAKKYGTSVHLAVLMEIVFAVLDIPFAVLALLLTVTHRSPIVWARLCESRHLLKQAYAEADERQDTSPDQERAEMFALECSTRAAICLLVLLFAVDVVALVLSLAVAVTIIRLPTLYVLTCGKTGAQGGEMGDYDVEGDDEETAVVVRISDTEGEEEARRQLANPEQPSVPQTRNERRPFSANLSDHLSRWHGATAQAVSFLILDLVSLSQLVFVVVTVVRLPYILNKMFKITSDYCSKPAASSKGNDFRAALQYVNEYNKAFSVGFYHLAIAEEFVESLFILPHIIRLPVKLLGLVYAAPALAFSRWRLQRFTAFERLFTLTVQTSDLIESGDRDVQCEVENHNPVIHTVTAARMHLPNKESNDAVGERWVAGDGAGLHFTLVQGKTGARDLNLNQLQLSVAKDSWVWDAAIKKVPVASLFRGSAMKLVPAVLSTADLERAGAWNLSIANIKPKVRRQKLLSILAPGGIAAGPQLELDFAFDSGVMKKEPMRVAIFQNPYHGPCLFMVLWSVESSTKMAEHSMRSQFFCLEHLLFVNLFLPLIVLMNDTSAVIACVNHAAVLVLTWFLPMLLSRNEQDDLPYETRRCTCHGLVMYLMHWLVVLSVPAMLLFQAVILVLPIIVWNELTHDRPRFADEPFQALSNPPAWVIVIEVLWSFIVLSAWFLSFVRLATLLPVYHPLRSTYALCEAMYFSLIARCCSALRRACVALGQCLVLVWKGYVRCLGRGVHLCWNCKKSGGILGTLCGECLVLPLFVLFFAWPLAVSLVIYSTNGSFYSLIATGPISLALFVGLCAQDIWRHYWQDEAEDPWARHVVEREEDAGHVVEGEEPWARHFV